MRHTGKLSEGASLSPLARLCQNRSLLLMLPVAEKMSKNDSLRICYRSKSSYGEPFN